MILNDLKPESIDYLERSVNQRRYSKFCNFNEVDQQYRPESNKHNFKVPLYEFESYGVKIFENNPGKYIRNFFLPTNRKVRFMVHPNILNDKKIDDKFIKKISKSQINSCIIATPTASTRTVKVADRYPFYAKLHMPKRISRFKRRLRTSSIEHSVNISTDLLKFSSAEIAFLPEVLGIAQKISGWGFLIRDCVPKPAIRENRLLVPCFSLHSIDINNPDHPPLIVQLAKKSNINPEDFLVNKIIGPIVKAWCKICQSRGILLECHGQNSLLEIDNNYEIKRVVFRDFQSLMVDPEIRRENGLEQNFNKHVIGQGSFPREQEYSLTYDYLVAHHLFEPLLETMCRYFEIKGYRVKSRIKEIFRAHFHLYKECFPAKHIYQFEDKAFPDNKPSLRKIEAIASWR